MSLGTPTFTRRGGIHQGTGNAARYKKLVAG